MTEYFDWRLHGVMDVETVSAADDRLPVGSRSTLVLVDPLELQDGRTLAFPLPNATALMLRASERAYQDAQHLLDQAEQRPSGFTHLRSHSEAVDVAEGLSLAVLTAYTALECFANEWIPEWVTFPKRYRSGHKVLGKEEMERELPLNSKLDQVLPLVFQVKSPKGHQLWEAFVKLESTRNRVVHMKHADREPSERSVDTVWKRLFTLPPPHATAKRMVDWYMAGRPMVPGMAYDQLKPVMPRWFFECPIET